MPTGKQPFALRLTLLRRGGAAAPLPLLAGGVPLLCCNTTALVPGRLVVAVQCNVNINYYYDRVRCDVRLGGAWQPLGQYVVVQARQLAAGCFALSCLCLCQLARRCVPQKRLFFAAGTPYTTAVAGLLALCGLPRVLVRPSTAVLQTPREDWELGTSVLDVVNALLREINYLPLHMRLDGTVAAVPRQLATAGNLAHRYGPHQVCGVLPGAQRSMDTIGHANVFHYSCQNPELPAPLYATSTNQSPHSPHSVVNAPVCPVWVEVDNTAGQQALQQQADAAMHRSMVCHDEVRFGTALAVHQPHAVVAVESAVYTGILAETAWRMPLVPGGQMEHTGYWARYS